uniref:Uncharacterized protein n=1 Tax=viral metagenome TaxID=1070528 RepID=A0A6C0ELB3_9ZZZZ
MDRPNLFKRFVASYNYVQALQNLPPTYETGEVAKFKQVIPDPVSEQNIQIRLNDVEAAQKKLKEMNEKKN